MPRLKINGQQIEVEEGVTVLQAAERLGITLPRYCYHPGLSIAGNCRICMVEVGGRTMTSCSTICAEGMEVETDSARAREARRAVMEFLLVNHPLDCPVCDQAGECKLQDFYLQHGRHKSRVPEEQKVRKGKALRVGKNVCLDQERCILCSRCVRFCAEVTGTYELGIFQRGDHAVLDVVPGRPLSNDYSGNVVDICPVGALTDSDFRFRMRVWHLQETETICPGCSRGCNIYLHTNLTFSDRMKQRAYRIKPRVNQAVNGYWICDEGRYGYVAVDRGRVAKGSRQENGQRRAAPRAEILKQLAEDLCSRSCLVLLSPHLTNEELYLAKKLFDEELKARVAVWGPRDPAFADNLLRTDDRFPNRRGAQLLGLEEVEPEMLLCDSQAEVMLVFHHDLQALFPGQALSWLEGKKLWFFATHESATANLAYAVIPVAVYAEKAGSFTNVEGKIQPFAAALPPLGEASPEWILLRDLFHLTGRVPPGENLVQIRQAMGEAYEAFGVLSELTVRGPMPYTEKIMQTVPRVL